MTARSGEIPMTLTDSLAIIPSSQRHRWDNEWLTSRQSFPATGNFDLVGNAHGVLMVNNDDIVDVASGFDTHDHADTEIITWVVEGSLHHRDSAGNEGTLTPGVVQLMTAGTGIRHSERNASPRSEGKPLRVVQMWVATEYAGAQPGYAENDVAELLASGELVPVVSGLDRHRDTSAIRLPNRYAALHVARLPRGRQVELPPAPYGHLYVVKGHAHVGTHAVAEGDAVRFTGAETHSVIAADDTEILYWEMHTGFADRSH